MLQTSSLQNLKTTFVVHLYSLDTGGTHGQEWTRTLFCNQFTQTEK